ncbi:flavo protein WrbA [Basidiobolus meristosporus CBS 931.73]|uniref:Flavo protein WrbA n=1 Tax=Basidiobolus meristosporus CBS 931.73 TaxID=1314790 RepID=A0A1Y1YZY6_9FUNG|nr:flavo protein WrbA [Basidiobolus meristosporus CBS 931.73]|eukprot:ORY03610.1 flavo protein WrbA [Basidiobolus meristosporus CBS 931.73]
MQSIPPIQIHAATHRAKVLVIFYTLYGHVYQLAKEVQLGLEKNPNLTVEMYQIPETIPEEVLQSIGAPPKPNVPIITLEKLQEADGILFGIPTRYGAMPSQYHAFWETTLPLWTDGALHHKLAGTFFSTSCQRGGHETTGYTFITNLTHHGMIYVPLGFTSPHLTDNTEVIGGSPWGAGTITNGDGSRPASQKEREIARLQGEHFGQLVLQVTRGKCDDESLYTPTNSTYSTNYTLNSHLAVREKKLPKKRSFLKSFKKLFSH